MKVHHVQAAQAVPIVRACGAPSCGREIVAGEPYKWAKPRTGPRRYRCRLHNFRPSDLVGGRYSEALAVEEGASDDLRQFEKDKNIDSLESGLTSAVEEARRIAEEYEDGIQNMPDSLQDSPTATESQERADALTEWADELEAVDFDTARGEIETAVEEADAEGPEPDIIDRINDDLAGEVDTAIDSLSI